jgi:hypothetical protein
VAPERYRVGAMAVNINQILLCVIILYYYTHC